MKVGLWTFNREKDGSIRLSHPEFGEMECIKDHPSRMPRLMHDLLSNFMDYIKPREVPLMGQKGSHPVLRKLSEDNKK